MDKWLTNLLALCPADLGWEAKRRWLYLNRWPQAAQNEALCNASAGDGTKLAKMNADVAAIKAAVPNSSPSAPAFKDAVAELTSAYRSDLNSLQMSWVSVAISAPADEATKKAAIVADIAARKAQFSADYAALKSSYGV